MQTSASMTNSTVSVRSLADRPKRMRNGGAAAGSLVSSRASAICYDYPVPVAVAVGCSHTGLFRIVYRNPGTLPENFILSYFHRSETCPGGFGDESHAEPCRDRHWPARLRLIFCFLPFLQAGPMDSNWHTRKFGPRTTFT